MFVGLFQRWTKKFAQIRKNRVETLAKELIRELNKQGYHTACVVELPHNLPKEKWAVALSIAQSPLRPDGQSSVNGIRASSGKWELRFEEPLK